MIDHSKVPVSSCPACGYRLDAATSLVDNNHVPGEGDFTVCMACTCVMRYNGDLTTRVATEADMKLIKEDPENWKMLQVTIEAINEVIINKGIKLSK